MGAHYDYVIVDSAPILPVSDSVALSGAVDGVLVVAQAGRASDNQVGNTIERLQRVAAPLLGFVLNQASKAGNEGAYTYGGYTAYRRSPDDTAETAHPGNDVLADFADGVDDGFVSRAGAGGSASDGGASTPA
jgi:Mrp family chromosome partitioning ATPase